MTLYRGIDFENLEDGEYIQFFGVHMLSWGDIERATGIKPTIAFIEDDTLENQKAMLLEACEFAINKLNEMTTDEFSKGGDKAIREKLLQAIAEVGE